MKTSQKNKNEVVVIKNYRYLEKIGEGGYGLVFKAKQISTGQIVAIKTLKVQEGLTDQKKNQQLARFERETRLCAEINHPNIVQLIDKGYVSSGEPYAVFEYVQGETLKSYILRNKRLSAIEMATLMDQVLDALVCAHNKGIVHRDLKPQNIMVSKMGSKNHVKILDFGIGAFTHDFRSKDYQSLTVTQDILGTPTYSAPEQLRGEPPTIKSDLYAWGLIVIECLTGKPVMDGLTVADVFQKQLMTSNVPIPPSIAGHALGKLLRKVLEKKPENRAADAQVIFEEFKQINFNTLIGDIEVKNTNFNNLEENTAANSMVWSDVKGARKQITVLCIKLNLVVSEDIDPDLEILDTVQKDQMNRCIDTVFKYKGFVTESLMNTVVVCFGYPESNDTDKRRAGRTAFELISEVKKRSALLLEQHGICVNIQISLHSGIVLIRSNHLPEGKVLNTALDLVHRAKSGSILASSSSKKLLDSYYEFEEAGEIHISNETETLQTYHLTGEHQTESLSFLHPRSAIRKMIGRDKEKANLLKAWDKVKDKGLAVLITGIAGIGKSKLMHEVKKHVQYAGGIVYECRYFPEYQNNALYPFFNMFRNQWGIIELKDANAVLDRLKTVLEKAGCKLEESLPLLCSWLSVPMTEEYTIKEGTPEEQKQVLFNTLKLCLNNLGRGESFLLVVEDLHWLDHTSAEFIEYIISDIEEQKFLLLMSSRPTFKNPWKLDCLSQISLKTLSDNSINLLVKGVLDGNSVSKKALNYISERADGIPLYAEELTSMLLEQKYIELNNDKYGLVEDIGAKMIPTTLQDLLNSKLDSLSQAKETAQLAASIGREFSYELLSRVSLKDKAAVQSDLNLLMQAGLVYCQQKLKNENYIFRHALIRDAAYEGILSSNLKEIHGRIANTFEAEFPDIINDEPALLAFHWSNAHNYEKASLYGCNSALRALTRSLFIECINHANKAILWARKIEDETLKINRELQINQHLVQALIAIKGFAHEEVKKVNDRSEELSLLLPDGSKWLLNILWTRIQFNLMSADYAKYEVLWQKAEKDALELKEQKLLVALYGVNGYKNWLFGEYEKAETELLKSIKIYNILEGKGIRDSFGIDYKVYCYMVLANVYAFKGDINKSEDYGNRGAQMMEELNDAHTKAYALALYISLYFYRNEPGKIEQLYKNHIDFLKEHEFTSFLYLFDTLNGLVQNNVEEAGKNRELIETTGVKAAGTYYSLVVAQTAYNAGKYKISLEKIEGILLEGEKSGEKFQFADLYRLKAMCLAGLSNSNSKEVDAYFEKALQIAEETNAILYQLRVLMDCYETTNNKGLKEKCFNKMNRLKLKMRE